MRSVVRVAGDAAGRTRVAAGARRVAPGRTVPVQRLGAAGVAGIALGFGQPQPHCGALRGGWRDVEAALEQRVGAFAGAVAAAADRHRGRAHRAAGRGDLDTAVAVGVGAAVGDLEEGGGRRVRHVAGIAQCAAVDHAAVDRQRDTVEVEDAVDLQVVADRQRQRAVQRQCRTRFDVNAEQPGAGDLHGQVIDRQLVAVGETVGVEAHRGARAGIGREGAAAAGPARVDDVAVVEQLRGHRGHAVGAADMHREPFGIARVAGAVVEADPVDGAGAQREGGREQPVVGGRRVVRVPRIAGVLAGVGAVRRVGQRRRAPEHAIAVRIGHRPSGQIAQVAAVDGLPARQQVERLRRAVEGQRLAVAVEARQVADGQVAAERDRAAERDQLAVDAVADLQVMQLPTVDCQRQAGRAAADQFQRAFVDRQLRAALHVEIAAQAQRASAEIDGRTIFDGQAAGAGVGAECHVGRRGDHDLLVAIRHDSFRPVAGAVPVAVDTALPVVRVQLGDRRIELDPRLAVAATGALVGDVDAGGGQRGEHLVDAGIGHDLLQHRPGAGDMRCCHRGAVEIRVAAAGHRRIDRRTRCEQVHQRVHVRERRHRVGVGGRRHRDRGRDAGRRADRIGVAVVAGRDHGGDVDRAQVVDRALARVAVATGGVRAAAEAHVDRCDRVRRVQGGVDVVQCRELIAGVAHHAGRAARAAASGVVEAGEYLDRDDVGAARDAVVAGAEAGCDAGDVAAVVAELRGAIETGGDLGLGRSGAGLRAAAVRAQADLAGRAKPIGEAGFGDDPAVAVAVFEERVVAVDAGVEDHHRLSAAVEALTPDRRHADHGSAARERRRHRLVFLQVRHQW